MKHYKKSNKIVLNSVTLLKMNLFKIVMLVIGNTSAFKLLLKVFFYGFYAQNITVNGPLGETIINTANRKYYNFFLNMSIGSFSRGLVYHF